MKLQFPIFGKSIARSQTDARLPAQTNAAVLALQLSLAGAASLAIYLAAFVQPYSLLQWAASPQMSIPKMTHHDPRAGVAFLIAFGALFGLYWFAAGRVRGVQGRPAWAIVIGGAVAFSAALLFLYPVDALDVFDYIMRGRMQALYGGNPFYQFPSVFRSDPFLRFTGWPNAPTAYGPGWEMLAAVLARAAGDNLVTNILAFKLLNVAAYGGTVALVAALLGRFAPERALFGVLLLAWNPLVVYVVAGNGHNDALMIFLVVLGFYFLAQGHFTLAALAQVAGALVKFIPALLFPLMLLAGYKHMKTRSERISYLLITGGASAILTMLFFLPFYRGGDFFWTGWRGKMFTTSLPTWAVLFLQYQLGISAGFAALVVSRAAVVLLGAWVGRELLRLWRRKEDATALNWIPYVQAGLSIFLFYLLVTCLWFQPWYVIWGVALAALLPESGITRATIFLSMMSNWKMLIFDYLIVHGGPLPALSLREWPLTALTLGPTWAFLLYQVKQVRAMPSRLSARLRGAAPGPSTDHERL